MLIFLGSGMPTWTRARHTTMDIWLSIPPTDRHVDAVKDCVRQRLTVLQEVEHTFIPHGLTAVFILSESHFSIHTYPEHDYVSLDCYVCNPEVDLDELAASILSGLPYRRVEHNVHARETNVSHSTMDSF